MENKHSDRDTQATEPMVELFRPSLKSRWIQPAIGLIVAWALLVLYLTLSTPVWHARALGLLGAWLVFGAALGLLFFQRIRADQRPVKLTVQGIESKNFSGKQKSYAWRDIASAWIVPIGDGNALHLELANGVANTAGAWHSRRSRPFVPLATFTATEQDLIFDAVLQHLRQTHGAGIAANTVVPERELMEQVIASATRPWATYALMLVNVVLAVLMLSQGADLWSPSTQTLLRWGGNAASEVQKGQWWRVLTALFVHSGLLHLTFTLLGLWSLGRIAERIYGLQSYLMIYLGSALVASAVSLHFSAQKVVFIGGATSAALGLAGSLLLAVYQHREILTKLLSKQELAGVIVFVLYAVVQGFRPSGLDNAAHLGALLAGAALAALAPERFDRRQFEATVTQRSVVGLATALLVSSIIAVLAPPAHTDLPRLFTGPAAFEQGVKSFADTSALMGQLQQQVKSGQLSETDFDAKTRSVLAPALRQAKALFDQAWFPATDPRNALIQEYRHLSALMIELLAMNSVVQADTSTIAPVDPVRATHLNADIRASAERVQEIEQSLIASVKLPQNKD